MIPCRSGATFFNLNLTRFLCTHPRSACCGAFDQLSTGLFYLLGIGASFCGVGGFLLCLLQYSTVSQVLAWFWSKKSYRANDDDECYGDIILGIITHL